VHYEMHIWGLQFNQTIGVCCALRINRQYNSEELYFMLLVTLALKTLLSVSQNGISSITLNKHLGNHLNKDIVNASRVLGTGGASATCQKLAS
jgi:hypothetical protein